MAHAGFSDERFEKSLQTRAPDCYWAFNKARKFEYVCGDSPALFAKEPAELINQHISIIEDAQGIWAARIDLIFTGRSRVEKSIRTSKDTLIHLPILAEDRSVLYAAGFAYSANQKIPSVPTLELAALLSIGTLKMERGRVERFLHDIVAQSLTGTGLQVELLRLEMERRGLGFSDPIRELQRFLDEALARVRQFNREESEDEGLRTA